MNRCRHNPPCQRREYWGRGGAGVLFTCSEDGTVLLLLRAAWVEQGGTWGIPGGGIGEGFYRTPVQPITDMRVFLEKAKEEVEEECGSLPPGVRSLRADLPFTEYEDCGFRYVTFILDITKAQKAAWAPFSDDGENDAFVWFPLDAVKKGRPLPDEDGDEHDIHFGVTFTMGKLPRANPRRRNPEPTIEAQRDRHGDIAGVTVHFAGGSVSAIRSRFDKPDVMHVGWSELPESARGKGLGVQMYAALMDWALENGITLTSDEALSPAAGRVWEALAKRGYPIQKHPTARLYTEDDRSAWGADDRNKPFTLKRNPRRRNPAPTDTPTSSAAFRRWFGASKVVDAEGRPLVVYHGTTAVFDVFDFHAGIGAPVPNSVYFTDSPDLATYVSRMGWGKPPVVIAAYLRMENPLVLDAKGKHAIDMTDEVLRKLRPSYRSNAHDGVILLNVREFQQDALTTTYAVLEPTQIKAVDAATFDPADPNFRRNPRPTTAERTDPALWEAVKREVTAGSKGGVRGEWSARKAQLAVALYKQRGGGYLGPKSPQNALAKWTREDWRTRSGKPSLVTGERYLPARAIAALTDAEYAATTRAKRAGMRKGQQFVPQPERIAAKAARYRKNTGYAPLRWEDGDDEDDLDFEATGHLTDAVSAILHGMELTGQGKPSASEVSDVWQREGVSPYARALYLHSISVSPGLRRTGEGRRYVSYIENDVRRQGVEVVVGHADHSLGFWQKQGYTLWPSPPSKYPEMSAIMYKVLGRSNPARRAGDKRYRKNPTAPEDVLEEYSYGKCAWLALALHERFGWPMTAEVQTDDADGARYVSHSWVTMPDGREVDIYGPQLEVDRFGGKETRMSRKALISLVRETNDVTEGWVVQRVAEANKVIDAYLLPELLLTNPARRAGDKRYRKNPDPPDTAAFRRWFGASKVVDAEGKPLVVYHGTVYADFDTFKADRGVGVFFTADYEAAQLYAGSWDAGEWTGDGGDHCVYRVYLRILRPLVVDAKGASYGEIVYRTLPARLRETIGTPRYGHDRVEIEDIARAAPRLGYDGVIVRNVVDDAGQEPGGLWWRENPTPTSVYVVFDSTQIKSANRNVGTFAPADPRITHNPRRRNPSPREAEALRAIRANLTPDLLAGEYRACAGQHPMAGHCSVATEALYFTLGGKTAGYTPMNVRHEGVSHWYLRTPDGRYLDPTADQFDTPVNYASGRGRGFPTPRQGRAEPPPSKRAAVLLSRIGARKR